jgi:hypothetical protein
MIIHLLDEGPHAGSDLHRMADQGEVELMVCAGIFRRVHQLHREVDLLRQRIGAARRHDVFFPQYRHRAVDQQARALIVVRDDTLADEDALAGLEFDLQAHDVPPGVISSPTYGSGYRLKPP